MFKIKAKLYTRYVNHVTLGECEQSHTMPLDALALPEHLHSFGNVM